MSLLTLSDPRVPWWTGQPAFWRGKACHQTPDDLWNFAETIWDANLATVVEVGRGEGGTADFLCRIARDVISVDLGDPAPHVSEAFVILDGDVYDQAAMLADLETYSPMARWLVICHSIRRDWGAHPALIDWWLHHPEWREQLVRHPSQHTWLIRT